MGEEERHPGRRRQGPHRHLAQAVLPPLQVCVRLLPQAELCAASGRQQRWHVVRSPSLVVAQTTQQHNAGGHAVSLFGLPAVVYSHSACSTVHQCLLHRLRTRPRRIAMSSYLTVVPAWEAPGPPLDPDAV